MENEVKPQLAQSHHTHFPKGYDRKKVEELLQIVEHEALDQLEAGQNLGVISPHY